MGWDFYTYNAQPAFFIEEIVDCMQAEDKAELIKQAKDNQK